MTGQHNWVFCAHPPDYISTAACHLCGVSWADTTTLDQAPPCTRQRACTVLHCPCGNPPVSENDGGMND